MNGGRPLFNKRAIWLVNQPPVQLRSCQPGVTVAVQHCTLICLQHCFLINSLTFFFFLFSVYSDQTFRAKRTQILFTVQFTNFTSQWRKHRKQIYLRGVIFSSLSIFSDSLRFKGNCSFSCSSLQIQIHCLFVLCFVFYNILYSHAQKKLGCFYLSFKKTDYNDLQISYFNLQQNKKKSQHGGNKRLER